MKDMMTFHTLEYMEFLRDVKPSNVNEFPKDKLLGYNVGEDWYEGVVIYVLVPFLMEYIISVPSTRVLHSWVRGI